MVVFPTRPVVIVVGLGVMGSATTDALARRGVRVLALESGGPQHREGSSHGMTRVVRRVIEEAPFYQSLISDAFVGWAQLEADSGQALLNRCGVIRVGPAGSPLLRSVCAAAELAGLAVDQLDAREVCARYPGLRVPEGHAAVFESAGGVVMASRAVAALRDRAVSAGALLHFGERVIGWEEDGEGVRVTTTRATHRADSLVLTAGAWTPSLLPELGLPLVPHRVVNVTFEPDRPQHYRAPDLPAFIIASDDSSASGLPSLHGIYGTPAIEGQGVKVGRSGAQTHLGAIERQVSEAEVGEIASLARRWLPGAIGTVQSTLTCLYTKSPDEHFVIQRHPGHPRVVIASPCSGHGFKFAPAIGGVLADLATDIEPAHDISPFSPARFAQA